MATEVRMRPGGEAVPLGLSHIAASKSSRHAQAPDGNAPAPTEADPLSESVQSLETRLRESVDEIPEPVAEAIKAVQSQLAARASERAELSSYTEQAVGQAEALKKENDALRKAKQEALMDKQLAKKLSDTEKLATASTAYKKDLIQKNLVIREQEVLQAHDKLKAAERQIKGLTTQLSDVRRAHREALAELEDLKEKASATASGQAGPSAEDSGKAPQSEGQSAEVSDGKGGLGNEHEALAARLLESGSEKLDSATIAAAAAGLRDTSVLEKQLKRARDDNERLQREIQQLNDTVFSKSFKAPSAWAEREVKYKMEKRSWEQQVSSLKEHIRSLTEENRGYRESNKAAEFENQVKELKATVKKVEAERTSAQQALHELRLQMREMSATHNSSRRKELAPEDANVHNLISAMEEHGIGVQQPKLQGPSRGDSRSVASPGGSAFVKSSSASDLQAFPAIGANLQELIEDYDDQGIGMAKPFKKKKSLKEKPSAFTNIADAEDVQKESRGSSLENVKDDLRAEFLRMSRQGSEAGSELGHNHSRRPTWSAELPEVTPAPAAGPSRLRAETSAADVAGPQVEAVTNLVVPDLPDGLPLGQQSDAFRHASAASAVQPLRKDAIVSKEPAKLPGQAYPDSSREPARLPTETLSDTSRDQTTALPPRERESRAERESEDTATPGDSREATDVTRSGRPGDIAGEPEVHEKSAKVFEGQSQKAAADRTLQPHAQAANLADEDNQGSAEQGNTSTSDSAASDRDKTGLPRAEASTQPGINAPDAQAAQSVQQSQPADPDKSAPDAAEASAQPGISTSASYPQPDAAQAAPTAQQSQSADHNRSATNSHSLPERDTFAQITSEEPLPARTSSAIEADHLAKPSSQLQPSQLPSTSGPSQGTGDNFMQPLAAELGHLEVIPESATVSERVEAHGYAPSLPAKHDTHRDRALQNPPQESEEEAAQTSELQPNHGLPPLKGSPRKVPASKITVSEITSEDDAMQEHQDFDRTPPHPRHEIGHILPPGAESRSSNPRLPPEERFSDSDSGLAGRGFGSGESAGIPSSAAEAFHAKQGSQPDASNRKHGLPSSLDQRSAPLGARQPPQSAFSEIEALEEVPPLPSRAPLQQIRTDSSQPNGRGTATTTNRFLSRNSSDSDSPWTLEKINALKAEKKSVDAEWREHVADQDIGTLKYRAAELSSRVEMHEAQIQKMSHSLEMADQEKARLEEDLEIALRTSAGGKPLNSSDQKVLDDIRERMQKMSSDGPTPNVQRLKETEAALQQAHREMELLNQQRDELQKQLTGIAGKLNSGIIPDPEELDLPKSMQRDAESAEPGTVGLSLNISETSVKKSRSFNKFIEGFGDEEIEVMSLRQENSNMMDTLVRTKVELAETQGDYLKMRRALIRAVEKQAALADRLESLSTAYNDGDLAAVDDLIRGIFEPPKVHSGDIESLGEREHF